MAYWLGCVVYFVVKLRAIRKTEVGAWWLDVPRAAVRALFWPIAGVADVCRRFGIAPSPYLREEVIEYKGYSKVAKVCGVIAFLALGHIILKVKRPNDYALLKKPLTVSGIRSIRRNSNMVLCRVDLRPDTIIGKIVGRQYRLVDSPDDGLFPNDSDGLVDSVSRRDRTHGGGVGDDMRRFTRWTEMPFELGLYQIATEKYEEALAKINLSPGSETIGMKIGK